MKLGFLTAPFPETPLLRRRRLGGVRRLRGAGDRLLAEILRPHAAAMPAPATSTSPASRRREAKEIVGGARRTELADLRRSATIPNPLHPDPAHRETVIDHLKKVIVAAGRMGVPLVNTFCGGDAAKHVDANWQEALKVWPDDHRPCARQRRQARLRELPDDLQLRRMAGRAQHRLFALCLAPHPRGLGRRCRHELRSLAPRLADDRPGALHPRVRRRTCCMSTPRT